MNGCPAGTATTVATVPVPLEAGASLAVDDSALYLGSFHGGEGAAVVWSIPKTGGTPRRLWTRAANEGIGGLAVDDTHLYFTNFSAVRRIARSGGADEVLADGLSWANRITLDGPSVYWVTRGGPPNWQGNVARVAKSGGAVDIVAEGLHGTGVVVDASHIYALGSGTSTSRGGILKIPRLGGVPAPLTSDAIAGHMMVDTAAHLFVVGTYDVQRTDKETGATVTLYREGVGGHSIAVDEQHVYGTIENVWSGYPHPGAGKVLKVARAGGPVTEIAVCQPKPSAIAVDATHVYWLGWVTGEIRRAPK